MTRTLSEIADAVLALKQSCLDPKECDALAADIREAEKWLLGKAVERAISQLGNSHSRPYGPRSMDIRAAILGDKA